jgi:hypothetical protein
MAQESCAIFTHPLPLRDALNEQRDSVLMFTREQADSDLVNELEYHRLMPKYKVLDEDVE